MAKLHTFAITHQIKAPPELVWEILTDHANMSSWTQLRQSTLEQEGTPDVNGVGAIRRLTLVGPPMREQITAFEPSHHLAYRLLSGAPVTDYRGEVNISPSGAGAKLVWSVQFRPKLPGVQFVVPLIIRETAKGLVKRAERG